MDIRIGNDIRLNVAISDFDILEGETIKCAHCFLMCEAEKRLSDVDPKSIKLPTKYTLHNYGGRIYNVLPFNVQVRPCGGPGLFGKSLRQYGRPIFTRVVEDDGYIYGYFQENQQLLTGDYYLVVMLVLNSHGFGFKNERHIVNDYGYAFTLTLGGTIVGDHTVSKYEVDTAHAYCGSSDGEPQEVDLTNKLTLPCNAKVTTSIQDKKKCHWVAVKDGLGYTCNKIIDGDGDDVSIDDIYTKQIGEYIVYYYLSPSFIGDTTTFTITKQS